MTFTSDEFIQKKFLFGEDFRVAASLLYHRLLPYSKHYKTMISNFFWSELDKNKWFKADGWINILQGWFEGMILSYRGNVQF